MINILKLKNIYSIFDKYLIISNIYSKTHTKTHTNTNKKIEAFKVLTVWVITIIIFNTSIHNVYNYDN